MEGRDGENRERERERRHTASNFCLGHGFDNLDALEPLLGSMFKPCSRTCFVEGAFNACHVFV